MFEPRPLAFGGDWAEIAFDGIPAIEAVLQAFVGRCQQCGCDAEEQDEGSVLVNPVIVDGTLYGDTFCVGCIDEDEHDAPIFTLPPLPQTDSSEEETD